MAFGPGFEQKRDYNNGEGTVFFAPLVNLRHPKPTNAGMQDRFEFPAQAWVGKDQICQFITAQHSIRRNDTASKDSLNLPESGPARPDEFAGQLVGVHHSNAALFQK